MNPLRPSATFPWILRKSVVRPQTTRFLTTSIQTPYIRCSRTSKAFQPIKPLYIQKRHASFPVAAKKLFKENPFSVSLATFFILFGIGTLVYTNYIYSTYIIGAFKAYPEPVAVKLRRALWYTNQDLQPKNALKYYQQALSVADELGMDPFSDEILGIKIQVASLLEKIQQYQKAIDVLETVRADCLNWIELLGDKAGNEGKRTRVLQKAIGMSVRLGELYSHPNIADTAAAEEKLVWAVTTVLKERQRREDEGVKEGEGDWVSNDEIGAALESLGTHYESINQHYLATPLFLQAVALSPHTSCHTVVLMNNLSVSLAQQLHPPTLSSSSPPASRIQLVQNARVWGERALAVAAAIQPPERNDECDHGCAVATINLGEFAEMEGLVEEARRRFEEGKGLSRAMGFGEGVEMADQGLRRLKTRET